VQGGAQDEGNRGWGNVRFVYLPALEAFDSRLKKERIEVVIVCIHVSIC
jgi:hypothetical protein